MCWMTICCRTIRIYDYTDFWGGVWGTAPGTLWVWVPGRPREDILCIVLAAGCPLGVASTIHR